MIFFRVICLGALLSVISCHLKEKPPRDKEDYSVKNTNKENITAVKQVETVEGNAEYYAFAMPKKYNGKLPLFVLIDPHGNGKFAVDKFKPALQDYKFVIIGLNNIRNNTPRYDVFIEQAVTYALQNLPADNLNIFYSGFSGGARMAFQYALTNNCKGVMMCGAGPQKNMLGKVAFPLVAVSGIRDFNFIEQYYPPGNFAVQKTDYISFYFDGKHEWPPAETIKESISFLVEKSGLQENISEKNIKTILNKKDSLLSAKEYIQAFKLLEKAYKTCDDKNKEIFLDELKKMNNNQNTKTFFLYFEDILKVEMSRNQEYYRCLFSKDINWWLNEIAQIDDQSKGSGDSLIANSYSRTRAFLGILLYSATSSAIYDQRDNDLIEKLLTVYENLEPENPDVYYFKALNELRQNNIPLCLRYLEQSKDFGFNDFTLLKKDFPVNIYMNVFK